MSEPHIPKGIELHEVWAIKEKKRKIKQIQLNPKFNRINFKFEKSAKTKITQIINTFY